MKKYLLLGGLVLAASLSNARSLWDKHTTRIIRKDAAMFIESNNCPVDESLQKGIVKRYVRTIKTQYPDPAIFFQTPGSKLYEAKVQYFKTCIGPLVGCETKSPNDGIYTAPTKENMVGHWYDGKVDFYLSPDGKLVITLEEDRGAKNGNWELQGTTLTLHVYRIIAGEVTLH